MSIKSDKDKCDECGNTLARDKKGKYCDNIECFTYHLYQQRN